MNAALVSWVGMMYECSTGELFTRAAFMYHDDKGHRTLNHYAALKGLTTKKMLLHIKIELLHINTDVTEEIKL